MDIYRCFRRPSITIFRQRYRKRRLKEYPETLNLMSCASSQTTVPTFIPLYIDWWFYGLQDLLKVGVDGSMLYHVMGKRLSALSPGLSPFLRPPSKQMPWKIPPLQTSWCCTNSLLTSLILTLCRLQVRLLQPILFVDVPLVLGSCRTNPRRFCARSRLIKMDQDG